MLSNPPVLYDGSGRRIQHMASAHVAASMERPMGLWRASEGSADADLLPELGTIRPRVRDLNRNYGVAAGYNQTMVDNVVGAGLRLSATPDYEALGRDAEWAEDWRKGTESEFRSWAETMDCDAGLELNFAGLTTLTFRSGLSNGESLCLPLWLPERGLRYSLALEIIEADRLSNPQNQMDTEYLRGGIERDKYGAPTAYHLQKRHPGDFLSTWGMGSNFFAWERVPARTAWGRRRVIHTHDKERTGQSRGKPIATAVLKDFKMLERYQDAELKSAIVNALIAAFIETPMSADDVADLFDTAENADGVVQNRSQSRPQLKAGSVLSLFPGEHLSAFTPSRPAAAYPYFMESALRGISAGLNVPYEILLKDFSKTNYSSARAALMEAWRFFLGRRAWLATYWCQPVYELWLEEAVSKGRVKAPGFYDNQYAYCRAHWIGPGRGWVDPVKEVQAALLRMDIGLSTLQAECAEQGKDWEEVLLQQAREIKRRRELGLPDPQWVSVKQLMDKAGEETPEDEETPAKREEQ